MTDALNRLNCKLTNAAGAAFRRVRPSMETCWWRQEGPAQYQVLFEYKSVSQKHSAKPLQPTSNFSDLFVSSAKQRATVRVLSGSTPQQFPPGGSLTWVHTPSMLLSAHVSGHMALKSAARALHRLSHGRSVLSYGTCCACCAARRS